MLRIHVVRDGGHAYYVDDMVPGRAEGSLVAGEEPGYWWGGGATALGLQARVDRRAFAEVLAGRDPRSGAPLRAHRAASGVSGYDLTFGAPKSVSLVHLLAPREVAEAAGAAHRAAVGDALGYLERAAVGVRRTVSGEVDLLPATGMVAGVFLHRTSRALDPHLHTHVVAANVAEGVDGRWSAVDSRRVFAHAVAARAVYHSRLRLEIGERMGGVFEVAPSGLGDMVGVDPSLRRLFSQRAAAMREFRHTEGRRGRSRKTAYFATRPEKDRHHTVESLRNEWRERAATFGFDLGDLTGVIGRRHVGPDPTVPVDIGRMVVAIDRLAGRDRSLARRDLVAEVASASILGARSSEIESMADRLLRGRASGGIEVPGEPTEPARRRTGIEPRWPARHVARALRDDLDGLVARPTLHREGGGVRGPARSEFLRAVGRGRGLAQDLAR